MKPSPVLSAQNWQCLFASRTFCFSASGSRDRVGLHLFCECWQVRGTTWLRQSDRVSYPGCPVQSTRGAAAATDSVAVRLTDCHILIRRFLTLQQPPLPWWRDTLAFPAGPRRVTLWFQRGRATLSWCFTSHILRPTKHKIGHFRDVLSSQSAGLVLRSIVSCALISTFIRQNRQKTISR